MQKDAAAELGKAHAGQDEIQLKRRATEEMNMRIKQDSESLPSNVIGGTPINSDCGAK